MSSETVAPAPSELLTHSRMACAKTCLRKHQFSYELGIRRDVTGRPLRLGSAFHLGLDHFYTGMAMTDAADIAVDGYADTPAWCDTDELVEDWLVEQEDVRQLLIGYAWRWGRGMWEVLASELQFNLPITNPETGRATNVFRLGGKIDKIVKLDDGRIFILEHKTTGDSIDETSDYWKRLRLDQQVSTYWLAATELGYDLSSVLYDVVHKPSIRPRRLTKADVSAWKSTGCYAGIEFPYEDRVLRETPQMYGARLALDMRSRPDFYFQRHEIPRLERDIEEFRFELWQQQQMLRDCQLKSRWPRNTNACLSPYRCEYLDICQNGVDLAQGPPAGFVKLNNIHPELEIK